MKEYLEAGEFVTTHGIAGELRLYPWSDEPGFLSGFSTIYLTSDGKKPVKLIEARPHKNICIVKLEGITSIEQARPLIGRTVWVARKDVTLPPGRYFVQDLLGLAVVDADSGEEYGHIANVTHPGRHDVYEVKRPGGSVDLFPATEPFLVDILPEEGHVTVRPIPGMFTPAEEVGEDAE